MDKKQTFAVSRVGHWGPSKINESNMRLITFKDIDTNKTYKMYDDDLFNSSAGWKDIEVGNLVQGVVELEGKPGYLKANSPDMKVVKK